jgi:hypothetical protein
MWQKCWSKCRPTELKGEYFEIEKSPVFVWNDCMLTTYIMKWTGLYTCQNKLIKHKYTFLKLFLWPRYYILSRSKKSWENLGRWKYWTYGHTEECRRTYLWNEEQRNVITKQCKPAIIFTCFHGFTSYNFNFIRSRFEQKKRVWFVVGRYPVRILTKNHLDWNVLFWLFSVPLPS